MAPAEICNPPVPVPETLWHAFTAAVARQPQAIAYTMYFQPADHLQYLRPNQDSDNDASHLNWSYSDLEHATIRLATGMLKRGVQRASTILTFLPNGLERELFTWVAVALQCTLMPLDPALFDPGRREELEYYIASVTPHIIVVENDKAAEKWNKVHTHTEPSLRILLSSPSTIDWISLQDLATSCPAEEENLVAQQDLEIEDNNERIAAILYTSGTSSGKPKGCAISTRQVLTVATVGLGWDDSVKSLVSYSANFRSMSVWLTWTMVLMNVRVIMPSPQVDVTCLLDALEEADGTILMRFMLHVFLQDDKLRRGERNLNGVKQIVLGGDVITVDLVERAKKLFPNAIVHSGHGMSETIGCLTPGKLRDGLARPALGGIVSAGTVNVAGCVRICDDQRKVLQMGEPGELHFGGPCVMKRYWQGEQPELFYEDEKASWMVTGDRAILYDDGSVFVIGRSKDIIKRRGITLSPAVLIAVLNRLPGMLVSIFGPKYVPAYC